MTRIRRQLGMSLMELVTALGIAGALGAGGYGALRLPSAGLAVASREIEGSLHQAFALARASGQLVQVSASRTRDLGHLPVSLPRTVAWGLPEGIPLPPGMDPTVGAAASGEAHPVITVTPRHTTQATVWFLHAEGDALCIRVNNHGRVAVLRWRASRGRWGRN